MKQENKDKLIYRLPGESPESYIYDRICEKLDELSGELAVSLLRSYEEQQKIAEIIRSVRKTNRDSHLLFSQVGKKLGFIAEDRVKEAFITLWARSYQDEVRAITQSFSGKIPLEDSQINISR